MDWELSTLGHPLADLAHLCMIYLPLPSDLTVKTSPGAPDETTLTRWYSDTAKIHHPIPNWPYFRAFACFRMAAIAQVSSERKPVVEVILLIIRVFMLEVSMVMPVVNWQSLSNMLSSR